MISLDVFEKQCNSYNQQLNGMVISKYSSSKISIPHLKSLCATTLLQEFFNHLTMDHLKYSRKMTKHSSSNGRSVNISVDRLKPAYILEDEPFKKVTQKQQTFPSEEQTRYGRTSRPP